jgi:membrane protease YdiL (CAAX protease family)
LVPLQAVLNVILVGFIAGWVRVVRKRSFTEYVHFVRGVPVSARRLIVLGASLAISVLIVSAFLPHAETPLEKLLDSNSAIVLFAIFGVLVAPLMEELIFRGFVFEVLLEIGGVRLAIPGSAFLFAAPHFFQLAGNWSAIASIFAVGSILGVLRHRWNSVIPSIITHTAYNSMIFVLYLIGTVLERFQVKPG